MSRGEGIACNSIDRGVYTYHCHRVKGRIRIKIRFMV